MIDATLWPENLRGSIVTSNSPNSFNKLTNCTQYQTYVRNEGLDFDNTLGKIENFFDCSGICTKSNFYALTNISQ